MKEVVQWLIFGVLGLALLFCVRIMWMAYEVMPKNDRRLAVGMVVFCLLFSTLAAWAFG